MLEDGSPVEVAADEDAAEQANAPGAAGPQPDATSLAAALAALLPRIANVADPAQKEVLGKQARMANVNIKTGNLTYAATGIEQLRRALDATTAATSSASVAEPADRSAPPPPPPPPTAEAKPDPAALAAALAVLVPRIAQITDAAQKEALAKQAREANVNIKTGNLSYAATGIEQLRHALDAIPRSEDANTEEPPPPPPPMPEFEAKLDPAALSAALASLIPRIARITDGAQKEALAKQAREANVNVKTGNLAYAATAIEALHRTLDASAPVASDTAQAAADPRMAQYQAAFAKLTPALEKVAEIAPQRREGIDLQTELFKAALAAAEFAQAKEALMELGLLAKPPADAAAESGADIEALNLAFRKSRLAWGQTRQKVHGQIRQFQAALRNELRDEPDFGALDLKVTLLDRVLQRLDGSLETKLDEAVSADKRDAKQRLKQKSRQQVLDYISFVNENQMIARLDSNRYMPLTVCADLTGQLAALAASLA